MFAVLGRVMVLLGIVGLTLGWVIDPLVADATAVVAGLSMLGIIVIDAARPFSSAGPGTRR